MAGIVPEDIESYALAHTSAVSDWMDALAEETRATLPSPGMLSGAVEGRLLEMLVFATGARRVLEFGTYSGYSSLSMARALPPEGRIVTLEVSDEHAAFARRHIEASPYADRIEVVVGPALDSVSRLDGPFDLVFIDADKENYARYYEAALAKLSPRGLIAVDNTLWSGRVLDPDAADANESTRGAGGVQRHGGARRACRVRDAHSARWRDAHSAAVDHLAMKGRFGVAGGYTARTSPSEGEAFQARIATLKRHTVRWG